MKKWAFIIFILLAGFQSVFSGPQLEVVWSTMLNNEAQRYYAKSEIMSLLELYDDVHYSILPMTRAAAIQRYNQDRAEYRSVGSSDSDIEALDQVIGWLRNNNNQNFAYAIFASSMGVVDYTNIGVVRGNNYYRIGFMDGVPINLDTRTFEFHPTWRFIDQFERHVDSILW